MKFKRSSICSLTSGATGESGRRRGDRCPGHRRRKSENDRQRNGRRKRREPLFATDQATRTGRVVSFWLLILTLQENIK